MEIKLGDFLYSKSPRYVSGTITEVKGKSVFVYSGYENQEVLMEEIDDYFTKDEN